MAATAAGPHENSAFPLPHFPADIITQRMAQNVKWERQDEFPVASTSHVTSRDHCSAADPPFSYAAVERELSDRSHPVEVVLEPLPPAVPRRTDTQCTPKKKLRP